MALKLKFMSDDEIIQGAVGRVKNYEDYSLLNIPPRPQPGGLYGTDIFGGNGNCVCGLLRNTPGICPSCRTTVYLQSDYNKNYAYYLMGLYIVAYNKFPALVNALKSFNIELIEFSRDALAGLYSTYFNLTPIKDTKDIDKVFTDEDGNTFALTVEELSENADFDYVGARGIFNLSRGSLNGKAMAALKEYVNKTLYITSPGLREASQTVVDNKIKISFNSPDHYGYRSIIYVDQYLANVFDKYNAVDKATINYEFNKLYDAHLNNSLLTQPSKLNLIRTRVATHLGASGRANAVSDKDAALNEVKVPISLAYMALQYQIVQYLTNKYPTGLNALELYNKVAPEAKEALNKIVENAHALLLRNPSLHRNNIIKFSKITLWENNSLGVNPLVSPNFNLDFDGDQMAIFFVTEEDQKVALGDAPNVENLWFYDKTHEPIYVPSATTLYGLYYASRIISKKNPKEFDKYHNIANAFRDNMIEVDEEVILMPNKRTTYGRERLSNILKTPIENFIGDGAIDHKAITAIVSSLVTRKDRVDVISELRDFGDEIATLIGIDVLPIKDLYKDMAPRVEAIYNDKRLPEDLKMKKIRELLPQLMKEELKRLPSDNMEILMQGRLSPKVLLSLYTPYVRFDDKGKVKIGDSSLASGLSEEEFVTNIQTQRTILGTKQEALPRAGYNRRQLAIAAMNLIYRATDNPVDNYIFYPEGTLTDTRKILKNIRSKYPGFVAVKSCATGSGNIIYKDELYLKSTQILRDGAAIGIAYADAVTEIITQNALGLKYGGLLNEYAVDADIISHDAGKATVKDQVITVGSQRYYLTDEVIPSDKVTNGEYINRGDIIAVNTKTTNVRYRIAEFVTFLEVNQVTMNRTERQGFYQPKGLSYAWKNGVISYRGKSVLFDGIEIGTLHPGITYFFPDGYHVKIGDRLSTLVLDMAAFSKYCEKEYAPWIFYKELERTIGSAAKGVQKLNPDLAEVLYKVSARYDFNIKKAQKTAAGEDSTLLEHLYAGSAKKKLLQISGEAKNITDEGSFVGVASDDDSPLLRILMTQGE